jgi:uncharacterized iron-regulated membrane protein
VDFLPTVKKIHLWLGILTGPLVFVIAITGCIYTFQEEIQNVSQSYRFYVKTGTKQLSPFMLKEIAAKNNPNKKVHAVQSFADNHASKVIFYEYEKYYEIAYLNPESGKVLQIQNAEQGFFPSILKGHFYLWLPPSVGQPLVASVTLIFAFVLISGLICWWPRSGKKSQRFKIKWQVSWKRRNFDLHSVLGFYVFFFALIFTLTGLVWGFEWFRNSYFSIASLGKEYVEYYEPESIAKNDSIHLQVNKIFSLLKERNPNFYAIEVHFPESEKGSIAANVNFEEGTYWKTDFYYFDQITLNELPVKHYWGKLKEASFAEKLLRMNYDIHIGAILGISGKIFAFLISLLIASLPVTGFLIYLGRKKTKK